MAPKIEPNQTNNHLHRSDGHQENPTRPVFHRTANNSSSAAGRSNFKAYGNQQKDRLERLYGAGAASIATMRDLRLAVATKKANWAFARTYQNEIKALGNPTAANAPKDLIEVSRRAETAYRAELTKEGFAPLDVRGTSVVKTADFYNLSRKYLLV